MAMNAGGPTCGSCGGLNTNPQSAQCRFCGQMLQQQAAPWPGYGPPPPGYGAPPPGGGYGAPPMQPPPGYPQQGYPQQGYAPNPYGAAPNPYAQQYPVQGFGGMPYQQQVYVQRSGWTSGWSTFFWIRLGIALVVILFSAMGACVQAISN